MQNTSLTDNIQQSTIQKTSTVGELIQLWKTQFFTEPVNTLFIKSSLSDLTDEKTLKCFFSLFELMKPFGAEREKHLLDFHFLNLDLW